MSHIIDGRKLAAELKEQVAQEVRSLKANHGLCPGLAVVLVGNDPASEIYVTRKSQESEAVGIDSKKYLLPENTTKDKLKALITELNGDSSVNGILVQLPLPRHLNASEVVEWIDPAKDVDGLHPLNAGRLVANVKGMVPCTPLGCLLLLGSEISNLAGMNAVIIGRSQLVGKPLANLLLQQDCTVTVAHSKTKNLPVICAEADIVVAAVGRANLVRKNWIKPGAVVLDVGINRAEDGQLVGDVDFTEVSEVAGAITPVPGGVGPMTVACLLLNTVIATARQRGVELSVLPDNVSENYRCLL